MKNIMIDIETLGTDAGSIILSIGACIFHGLNNGRYVEEERFYRAIHIDSQRAEGRSIDTQTLRWWMSQPPEARAVFLETGIAMKSALIDISSWISENAGEHFFIWSNTKMDIVMMEYEFKQHGIRIPWAYNKFRETKSFKMGLNYLFQIDGDSITDFISGDTPHNADYDAQWQAVEIGMYLDEIDEARKFFYGDSSNPVDGR